MIRRYRKKLSEEEELAQILGIEIAAEPTKELSEEERSDLDRLEECVKTAFFVAGMALAEIKKRKLFRSTHTSFESYCKERFGYGRDYADLKIKAAKIYQNLKEQLPTVGRQIPLPTNERQVRALVKSRLPAADKVEVWQEAVKIAKGKIPSGRAVKEAVEKYQNRLPMENPVRVGQICRIVAGDLTQLRGKGGCWGIVAAVEKDSCTIDTWNDEYILHPSHLQPLNYNEKERRQMEELGVRMTRLWERGKLEVAAIAFLKSLAKLDRPYLTELEEMWLEDLEEENGE